MSYRPRGRGRGRGGNKTWVNPNLLQSTPASSHQTQFSVFAPEFVPSLISLDTEDTSLQGSTNSIPVFKTQNAAFNSNQPLGATNFSSSNISKDFSSSAEKPQICSSVLSNLNGDISLESSTSMLVSSQTSGMQPISSVPESLGIIKPQE